MTDLVWPDDLAPFRVTFYLQPHVGGAESPFTRTRKTYALSAPRWICRMSFRGTVDGSAGAAAFGPRLDALIVQMQGGLNRIALWDFRRPYPIALRDYYARFAGARYSFTDGSTFQGGAHFIVPGEVEPGNLPAAAGATEMTFEGLPASTRVFQWGDYIGGDGRTHIVLDEVFSDAGGRATVRFEPPLASAVARDGANVLRPKSWFQLRSEDAGQNDSEVGDAVTYDLEFVEDLA